MKQEFIQSEIHINLKKNTNKLSQTIPSVHPILVNISFCSVRDEIVFTFPFRLTKNFLPEKCEVLFYSQSGVQSTRNNK